MRRHVFNPCHSYLPTPIFSPIKLVCNSLVSTPTTSGTSWEIGLDNCLRMAMVCIWFSSPMTLLCRSSICVMDSMHQTPLLWVGNSLTTLESSKCHNSSGWPQNHPDTMKKPCSHKKYLERMEHKEKHQCILSIPSRCTTRPPLWVALSKHKIPIWTCRDLGLGFSGYIELLFGDFFSP